MINIVGALKGIFSSGVVGTVEKIALEMIDTDKESAEAKALWIKTLDPNGIMRRGLSNFACFAYGFYLFATTVLIFIHAFSGSPAEVAEGAIVLASQSKEAMAAMTELFLPVTTAWGTIVTASFGVNYTNVKRDK